MSRDVLSEARRLLEGGQAVRSIELLNEAAADPDTDPVRAGVLLAQGHLALGDTERADNAYAQAAQRAHLGPHGGIGAATIQLQRAQLLSSEPTLRARIADDLERSLRAFQEAGRTEEFLQGLALVCRLRLLLHQADVALDRAARLRESARRLDRPATEAVGSLYAGLALEALWELGHAERGLQAAASHREASPEVTAQASIALARVRGHRGNVAGAAEAARAALDSGADPGSDLEAAWVCAAYGEGRADLQALAEAAVEAFHRDPALATTVTGILASALPKATDLDGALTILDEMQQGLASAGRPDLAVALEPAAARILVLAGRRAAVLPRIEHARKFASEAVCSPLLDVLKAQYLLATERTSEAIALAQQVEPALRERGLAAEATAACLVAARGLRRGGRLSEGRKALQKAVAASSDSRPLQALVALEQAQFLRASDRHEQALTALDALRTAPVAVQMRALALRAEILLDQERIEEAEALLDTQAASTPQHPATRLSLLLARLRLGAKRGEDATTLAPILRSATSLAERTAQASLCQRLEDLLQRIPKGQA